MRYKVPQDVQRADKIFYFLTLRQLIIMMIGGGITYLIFISVSKSYELNTFETVLTFIPMAIAAAIAFVKVKGLSLAQLTFLIVESMNRSPRRHWQARSDSPLVSLTQQKEKVVAKKGNYRENTSEKSTKSPEEIAKMLDSKV